MRERQACYNQWLLGFGSGVLIIVGCGGGGDGVQSSLVMLLLLNSVNMGPSLWLLLLLAAANVGTSQRFWGEVLISLGVGFALLTLEVHDISFLSTFRSETDITNRPQLQQVKAAGLRTRISQTCDDEI